MAILDNTNLLKKRALYENIEKHFYLNVKIFNIYLFIFFIQENK